MTRVTIMLPKHMDSYAACLEHAQQRLCDRFGGFTSYDARGGWHNGEEIEKEPVTVVETYADTSHENAVIFMDGIAEYVAGRNGYDESEIAFTVDDQMYVVETSDGELVGTAEPRL
jgi:hypothetical protein